MKSTFRIMWVFLIIMITALSSGSVLGAISNADLNMFDIMPSFVKPGTEDMPVVRIEINNSNMTSADTINSITFTSANSDDSDVIDVNLYIDDGDGIFNPPLGRNDTPIGSTTDVFSGKTVSFTNLGININAGETLVFFIAFDLNASADDGNKLDGYIKVGDFNMTNMGVNTNAENNLAFATVDNATPNISNLDSNDTDDTVRNDTVLTFTVTATDNHQMSRPVDLNGTNMTDLGGGNWQYVGTAASLGCVAEGNCTLTATAFDSAYLGKYNASINYTILIDNTFPTLNQYRMFIIGSGWTNQNNIFISPLTSPGIKDETRFRTTSNEIVDFSLEVLTGGPTFTRNQATTMTRPSGACTYWNGTVNACSGANLPDGVYNLNLTLTDNADNSINNNIKTVTIDNTLPVINNESISQDPAYNTIDNTISAMINETNIDSLWIEGNWTGVWANYTPVNAGGILYQYVIPNAQLQNQENIAFRFYANDSAGNQNNGTLYQFQVQNRNPAWENPTPAHLSQVIGTEDTLLSFFINASDADNDTITYYINDSSFNINQTTGEVTWMPPAHFSVEQGGLFSVIIDAGDPYVNITRTLFINITEVNDAPGYYNIPPITFDEETSYEFNVSAYFYDIEGDPLTFTASAVQNITITINNTSGMVNLTPDVDFFGTRTVVFTADDGMNTTDSNIVLITVNDMNDAPRMYGPIQNYTWNEDISFTFNLSDFYYDIEGDDINWSVQIDPTNINVNIDQDTGITILTPQADWNGNNTMRVLATDNRSGTTMSNIFILTVVNVNDAPRMNTTIPPVIWDEDTNDTSLDLSIYFYDIDSPDINWSIILQPNNVTVTIDNNTGIVKLDPATDWYGNNTMQVRATDGMNTTNSNIIDLIVLDVNDEPRMTGPIQNITWDEDTIDTSLNLSQYFYDIEKDDINWSIEIYPDNVTVTIDQDTGMVTLDPAADWYGNNTIRIRANDDRGATFLGNIFLLIVDNVNDAPRMYSNITMITWDEDTNTSFNLLTYFYDIDSPDINWSIILQPNNVTATIDNNTGVVDLVPQTDWYGTNTMQIRATDGINTTNSDVFTLNVTNVNDAPRMYGPIPNMTWLEDTVNSSLNLSTYYYDIDSPNIDWHMSVEPDNITTAINNGSGQVTFTPDGNFTGINTVRFVGTDGINGTESNLVYLTIINVNDPPIIRNVTGDPVPDQLVDEDATPWSIDLTDYETDPDHSGTNLTWTVSNVNTSLCNIIITDVADDILTFFPVPDANGVDIFTLTLTDGNGSTDTQNVQLTINPVNDAPTVPILRSPANNSNVTSPTFSVILEWFNSTDVENNAITYLVFHGNTTTPPQIGVTANTWYNVTGLIDGEDYYWYIIATDGTNNSAPSDMWVYHADFNHTPTIDWWKWESGYGSSEMNGTNNTDAEVDENSTLEFHALASDIDKQQRTYTWYLDGAIAAQGINLTDYNYTPGWYAAGNHNVTLVVQDTTGLSDSVEFNVTVYNVNRAPNTIIGMFNITIQEDNFTSINISGNFADPDADNTLNYSYFEGTGNLIIDINQATGIVTITPVPDWNGFASILFTATDDHGASTTPSVALVNVTPLPDEPVLTNPAVTPTEGRYTDTFRYSVTYTDADDDPATYVRVFIDNGTQVEQQDLVELTPSDGSTADGKDYYLETMLEYGLYEFYFEASDGTYIVNTTVQAGPRVHTDPPESSNVQTTPTNISAIITWDTNVATNGTVEYALAIPGALTGFVYDPAFGTSHSAVINGLQPGTTYGFQIWVCTPLGECNLSEVYNFTTYWTAIPEPDMNITNINEENLDYEQVDITWDTNLAADSYVDYGLSPTTLDTTVGLSTLTTSHSIHLESLQDNTTYYYVVRSCSAHHTCGESTVGSFTTEVMPGVDDVELTNVRTGAVDHDSAQILWLTNVESDSKVEYGTNINVNLQEFDPVLVTNHDIILTLLSADTTYYYRVTSCNVEGNCSTSPLYNFTTSPTPSVGITNVRVERISNESADILWNTDVGSTSQVDYGVDPTNLSAYAGLSLDRTNHEIHLSSLDADTVYYFTATSCTAPGQCSTTTTVYNFTTLLLGPVRISNLQDINAGETTATITWDTNLNADSKVMYGTNQNNLNMAVLDTTQESAHAMGLSNLASDTTYYYQAQSCTVEGICTNSQIQNFNTGTQAAMQISNIQVAGVTEDSARVIWDTNLPGTSTVRYGTQTGVYSDNEQTFTLETNHDVPLAGLTDNTTYFYVVESCTGAASPQCATSQERTFTTYATGQAPPLELINVRDENVGSTTVNIMWDTNYAANGTVEYSLAGGALDQVSPSTAFVTTHAQGLTGLTSSTAYDYRVTSCTTVGECVTSGTDTFTTTAAGTDTEAPTADAGNSFTVTVNQSASFDGTGSTDNVGIVWWEWNFGDGSANDYSGPSVSHTFTQTGSYTVTLGVNDAAGNGPVYDTITVTVREPQKLEITDLDIKIDGDKDSNLNDGEEIEEEAGPHSNVVFDLKIENMFDEDAEDLEIEDIEVKITIDEIDDGEEIDEESGSFDLDAGDDEDVSIDFTLPWEVEDGNYDVIIEVTGSDENGDDHEIEWRLSLEVEKEDDDIIIRSSELSPPMVTCSRQASIDFKIMNIGTDDQDNVDVRIRNSALGLDERVTGIDLDSDPFDEDSEFSRVLSFYIDDDQAQGIYPITMEVEFEDGDLADSKIIELSVYDCERTTSTSTTDDDDDYYYGDDSVQVVGMGYDDIPVGFVEDQEVVMQGMIGPSLMGPDTFAEPITQTTKVSFRESSEYMLLLFLMLVILIALIVYSIALVMRR